MCALPCGVPRLSFPLIDHGLLIDLEFRWITDFGWTLTVDRSLTFD